MSHGPGLFHVYFVGVGDANSNYTQNSPLYLVTFASRSEADHWWRATQLSSCNGPKVRRFSPQLIMAPLPSVQEWKCVIQTLKDNFNPRKTLAAASDSRPDHLNGGEYYIRSATRPYRFWFVDGGTLKSYEPDASYNSGGNYRSPTRFVIKRTETSQPSGDCKPNEDVLIGDDYVNIYMAKISTRVERQSQLVITKSESVSQITTFSTYEGDTVEPSQEMFRFSWFENGFRFCNGAKGCWKDIYVVQDSQSVNGQRWELVQ